MGSSSAESCGSKTMLPYRFSGPAKRFLKHADHVLARRLFLEIDALRVNPFPSDVKRVEGYEGKVFRVRVGDYRILYVVHDDPRSLDIVAIEKRAHAYD